MSPLDYFQQLLRVFPAWTRILPASNNYEGSTTAASSTNSTTTSTPRTALSRPRRMPLSSVRPKPTIPKQPQRKRIKQDLTDLPSEEVGEPEKEALEQPQQRRTERVARTPSFLDLPAELRNRIYFLVLPLHRKIFPGLRLASSMVPAIAQACRQVRDESLAIWRGTNIFCYVCMPIWRDEISCWLEKLSHCGLEYISCLRVRGPMLGGTYKMEANVVRGVYEASFDGKCTLSGAMNVNKWARDIERLTGKQMRQIEAAAKGWVRDTAPCPPPPAPPFSRSGW